MGLGRRATELASERTGGGRLTTATLLETERAPTARVLCLRAFRNILWRVSGCV